MDFNHLARGFNLAVQTIFYSLSIYAGFYIVIKANALVSVAPDEFSWLAGLLLAVCALLSFILIILAVPKVYGMIDDFGDLVKCLLHEKEVEKSDN